MKNIAQLKQPEKLIEPLKCSCCDELYWPAEYICMLLDISDVDQTIAELDSDEMTKLGHRSDSDIIEITVVNLRGLFRLLLKGQAPIAKDFRRWVTHDLLHEILLGEGLSNNIDWTIEEELKRSGFLPNWDMFD